MTAATVLIGFGLFSLAAFTSLGLMLRWSLRLSLAYAVTMTLFLGAIAGICTFLIAAVGK